MILANLPPTDPPEYLPDHPRYLDPTLVTLLAILGLLATLADYLGPKVTTCYYLLLPITTCY